MLHTLAATYMELRDYQKAEKTYSAFWRSIRATAMR